MMDELLQLLDDDLYSEQPCGGLAPVSGELPEGARCFANPPKTVWVYLSPGSADTVICKVRFERTGAQVINTEADAEWLDEVLP